MIIYKTYQNLLKQPHLLIAGATGSGKSVIINGLIYTALFEKDTKLILIDPKRVELSPWKTVPHCLMHATEPPGMIAALRYGLHIIEKRYKQLEKQKQRKYEGEHIYIIIDELADLMVTAKKEVSPLIQRICQIGRAANVHIIAATQCPIAKVIPTEIKVNFDTRIGLRVRSAQDSRNILGFKGLETLPRYGQAVILTPEGTQLYNIPLITEEQQEELKKAIIKKP